MTLHAPEQIQGKSQQELTKEFQITKLFVFMTESIPDVSPNPGRTWGLPWSCQRFIFFFSKPNGQTRIAFFRFQSDVALFFTAKMEHLNSLAFKFFAVSGYEQNTFWLKNKTCSLFLNEQPPLLVHFHG